MLLVCLWADLQIHFILNWKVDKDHDTALHDASAQGHTDVVKLLVERGIDFNAIGMSLG
jgi:ankyrin repeat protein